MLTSLGGTQAKRRAAASMEADTTTTTHPTTYVAPSPAECADPYVRRLMEEHARYLAPCCADLDEVRAGLLDTFAEPNGYSPDILRAIDVALDAAGPTLALA